MDTLHFLSLSLYVTFSVDIYFILNTDDENSFFADQIVRYMIFKFHV